MSKLSYLARVLASLILHSYQNYALCFTSRFQLFHSGPMEWNKEHVLFLREMLARNIFGVKKGSPARELAWEAIVDSLNEMYSQKFQKFQGYKSCTTAVKPSPKEVLQTDERQREGKWDFCRRVDGEIDYWKYSSRTSDYNINKLWHFTNASLIAVEHSVREYVRHLQGRKVCLLNAKFGFAVS